MNKIIKQLKQKSSSPELLNEAIAILKKNLAQTDPLDFTHSLRTGLILQKMGADKATVLSGILHHVPDDCVVSKNIPEKTIQQISAILKKINQLRGLSTLEKNFKPKPLKKWQKVFLNQQAENLRRMFFAVAQDIRPIFVTLAGRLDELRNFINYYDKEKRTRKAIAAIEILAPLAYGIGMLETKGQLEDLAFPVLYPKEYKWLLSNVKEEYDVRKKYLQKVKLALAEILKKEEIAVLDIHARAKHYFSLYQKLLRYNMDLDQIYDLVALRIIVPDMESCYAALGAIHRVWSPLKGRIKDYISSPKPNGYRSLHTTVFCQDNRLTEFQIKTPRMHQEAECGAAAHMSYKEKVPKTSYKYQFYWLDQLRRWQEEVKDFSKISDYLQTELFKDRIFVLSPKGDVISLPKGSTAVDFAYAVHSEIGDKCQGAKVDGKMAPLKQTLKTGQTIEIMTDKNKMPSSDWLRFVKTHKARSKIKSFLEKKGISIAKPGKAAIIKEKVSEKVSLLKKIIPLKKLKEPQVLIGGASGVSVKFSACCSPKPGDTIQAFITKAEGASLHKTDCANLKNLQQKSPQRIVQATWSTKK